jgi:hypothetical protein
MQPAWRGLGEDGRPASIDTNALGGQLTSLDIPGPRGWFALLVGLKWWGSILRHHVSDKQIDQKDDWFRAVKDILGTLRCLLNCKAK